MSKACWRLGAVLTTAVAVSGAAGQATKAGAGGDWPQWRGPKRDAVSTETGLLKEWPKDGPKLVWKASGLGKGYSSVSVAAGRIYTMGDQKDASYVYAVDEKSGRNLWSAKVGKPGGNYDGTRCTPTYNDGLIYALGQFGDLVCLDAATGRERWRKNYAGDFGGQGGGWNFCESPLIDGDKLICTPGGKSATMVALNKKTGAPVWKAVVPGDRAEYSSAVISEAGGVRQYVTLLAGGVVGVAAKDGKFLWKYDRLGNNTANIPTPIVLGENIFCSAGYGKGGALLKLTSDGGDVKAEEVYYKGELKNKHGGLVVVDDHVYGGLDDSGRLFCADVKTGKQAWINNVGNGSLSLVYADGCLYVRAQDHTVALIEATPAGFKERGSFKIPNGKREGWAHPVVAGGKLYIRNQDELLCYDVKAK